MDVAVDGVRGVCQVTGRGRPLVLLASPVAAARPYRSTAAALAGGFRVTTVELPGCGRADRLPAPWPVDRSAGWVAGLIDRLELDRPVVVGHSHAAAVAVVLAARWPDRVGRLVIVDATGTGPHPVGRTVAGGGYDLLLDARLVAWAWPAVLGNVFRHPANLWRQARDSVRGDVRADAARVRAPALVAWGGRDHTFPPRHAAEYARVLPDARVYLSPAGSHDWVITRAGEFAAAVAGFAAAGGSSGGRPGERAGPATDRAINP